MARPSPKEKAAAERKEARFRRRLERFSRQALCVDLPTDYAVRKPISSRLQRRLKRWERQQWRTDAVLVAGLLLVLLGGLALLDLVL